MLHKKVNLLGCFILIMALIITGCSTPGSGEKTTTTVDEKDTVVFGIPGEPASFDPHMDADNITDGCISNQVFDELIKVKDDGTFEPGLAESWEVINDDANKITTVVFKIRKGVKFHNGDELTIDDVVFSLNRAAESVFKQEITSALDHAEKIDDETVVAKFKYYYGPAETVIARTNIVNKKAVEADEEGFARHPIGTGPYKFVEHKRGDKIIFERFEDYYRGPATIKNLVLKVIVDPTTAALALEKGEIDLLAQPSMDDRNRLMNNGKLQYHESELMGNTFICFNNEKGIFTDKKLRQAVAYALDKESILIGAVEGAGVIVDNAIPRQCYGFSDEVKGYEHDVEKAKQLLADAGYPNGISLKMKTMESAVYSKPTEVLQDQLREIGISADVVKMERGAWLADILTNFDYDITIMSWVFGLDDADTIYALYHSNNLDDGQNFIRCDLPKLDELFDKGRASTDQEERKVIYKEAAQLINDECVAIPLYAYMVGVAADKNLNGVKSSSISRYDAYSYSW